MLLDAKT